jgi:hypothetical protein
MDLASKGGNPWRLVENCRKLKVRRSDTLLVNMVPLSVNHESDLSQDGRAWRYHHRKWSPDGWMIFPLDESGLSLGWIH